MAFCDWLEELAELVANADRVIWVQQDYTLKPPAPESNAQSPFRKAFAERKLRPAYWTTILHNVLHKDDKYINWNQLTWDPQPFRPLPEDVALMYYGAFRENRLEAFKRWLAGAPYHVQVSTTTLRGKKFKALDPTIEILPPFTGIANMPMARASIYIDDDKSQKQFHSPANRFYEVVSAGIPLFFDPRSIPMLQRARIFVEDQWIVSGPGELYHKLDKMDLDKMRQEQRDLWGKDYIDDLKQQVLQAWENFNA